MVVAVFIRPFPAFTCRYTEQKARATAEGAFWIRPMLRGFRRVQIAAFKMEGGPAGHTPTGWPTANRTPATATPVNEKAITFNR